MRLKGEARPEALRAALPLHEAVRDAIAAAAASAARVAMDRLVAGAEADTLSVIAPRIHPL